jgi:hypothetical protein
MKLNKKINNISWLDSLYNLKLKLNMWNLSLILSGRLIYVKITQIINKIKI